VAKAHKPGKPGADVRTPTPPAQPVPYGVQLLPGRFTQIRQAIRASVDDGVLVALIGRGPGSSELDPRYHRAQDVPVPQRTGPTWIGRILTETGWFGLLAFFGLLLWLALLGLRIWRESEPRTVDRAFGASLPGIAGLTAIGAVSTTILDVRGYSAIFWIVVGVALSAASELRNEGRP
jgi:hypothetical protein